MIPFVFLIIVAYLAGSVNFPIVLFRIFGKEDPRRTYSGNPGTTNVYRLAGPHWAATVLILDMGRAAGIAFAAVHFLDTAFVPWAGFALVLGNRFPCFHGFRGGKGVANFLGFTLPLAPLTCVVSGIFWPLVNKATGHPFAASFVMVLILAIGTTASFDFDPTAATGTWTTVLFIFHSHKPNIREYFASKKK